MDFKKTESKVAVLNSDPSIVDLFESFLSEEKIPVVGMVVSSSTRRDIGKVVDFLRHENPSVIFWDISPPYSENWETYEQVSRSPIVKGRRLVATTVDKSYFEQKLGRKENVLEFNGSMEEMNCLVQLARENLGISRERER